MLPLNHMIITYLISILVLNPLHTLTKKYGINTPNALAIIHEINTAKKNEKLNFSYSIPYILNPKYVNTKASAA